MRRWKFTLVTMIFISTFVLAWWGEAGAVPFSFQINRFRVNQNGADLVNDGFDDGVEPPFGPGDTSPPCPPTCTYRTQGTFGAGDESGSSLTLNNIGAQSSISSNSVPIEIKGARRRRRIQESNGAFFVEADFAGILPTDTQAQFGFREQYRISLRDFSFRPPANDNNFVSLAVRNVGGVPQIQFRDIFGGITLGTLFPGPLSSEITLRLDVDAAGNVTASFDPDGPSGSDPFTSLSGSTRIYDGEDFIFARFQALSPVPEPSTMLLLASGLAGLGFFSGAGRAKCKRGNVR